MTRWPPRPILSAAFYKGHGLGNDYLVFEEGDDWLATTANVDRVCDRHRGVGSDGIVVLRGGMPTPDDPTRAVAELRMFNPDGGEFERSGNGLRVLGSYLVSRSPRVMVMEVTVAGDRVRMTAHGRTGDVHDISVDMGRARVGADAVGLRAGVALTRPEGGPLDVVPVSIGNPHLVVMAEHASPDAFSEEVLAGFGPYLATHPALANGSNVQFARVTGERRCHAFIWERGVGRTSASGTSSCAVAVAMVASGRLAPGTVEVVMPGGTLLAAVTEDLDVTLRGPVGEVHEGRLRPSLVATFEREP